MWIADEVQALTSCLRAGAFGLIGPRAAVVTAGSIYRFGVIGSVPTLAAARFGTAPAIADELGTISYRELDRSTNAIANTWRAGGVTPGRGVGVLARNHRGLVQAVFAAAKCGSRVVLLNPDFSARQLEDVVEREGVELLVHDDEFADRAASTSPRLGRWRAWEEPDGTATGPTLAEAACGDSTLPPPVGTVAQLIVLTSGTTGTPKGAERDDPRSLVPLGALLERVPFRSGGALACATPMFHALGFLVGTIALVLGTTLVIQRRFDPVTVLERMESEQVTGLVAVPVMLRRLLDAEPELGRRIATDRLRVIFVAGSQLGAPLARRALDRFGPVLYNLYGSSEVAYATIATPADLEAEPACVGTPLRGVTLRILDDEGAERPTGESGRIFVGNTFQSTGYTGGGGKEVVAGLMSSGDMGHRDAAGRLFVDGRDDDMIVSGGENLFPGEVEALLATHDSVDDVTVIGVPDPEWGQRLRAFVVAAPGASVDEDGLKDFVRENLARFKIPREIVVLDEIPRNATGKVLKRELPHGD